MRLERAEIADGQVDHTARAEYRLSDESSEVTRRLAVEKLEAVVQFLLPRDTRKARTKRIGRRNGKLAGHQRSVALAADRIGRRRGSSGRTVIGLRERTYFPLACDDLRQPDCGL